MQLQASECKNTDYATSCIIMQTAPLLIYCALIALISLRSAFNLKDIFQILIPTLVRPRHVRSPSQMFVRTKIIRCHATRAYGTRLQLQGSFCVLIHTQVDYSHTKMHTHNAAKLHIMQIGVSTHY